MHIQYSNNSLPVTSIISAAIILQLYVDLLSYPGLLPIPLTKLGSNFKSHKIRFTFIFCHINQITVTFCPNHYSNVVLVCAKFHDDQIDILVFNEIWDFINPDSKVYVASTGPTWVLSAPGGPHVGPINLAVRETFVSGPVWGSCKDSSLPAV